MLYYLDTNIVIYAVQAGTVEHQRTVDCLSVLEAADHQFVISELTRTETLVLPLQPGNEQLLRDFFQFFHGPNLRTIALKQWGAVIDGLASAGDQARRGSGHARSAR